ncbi:hypothetical protein Ptr902_02726 [Pyrenophora tritici-repentis]|nr:hypothetical protein L13192_12828 [Pyrenophora tritici-repentis]KAI1663160.1 hypothetical protein L13192_12799 [Pyrenophora tritici-repentis]KAI1663569.1 hypothetical protein L13192_12524 [Pyrenophora tritici-repentis]KAI1665796.1 hypothetical protein L13192_10737 [Pyrenophora tritici-repentis]KAI1670752.1 hypothetical protein L13192_06268 [Pyrenophora tritici-repentis]
MDWAYALDRYASQFNGGPRSFALSQDQHFLANFPYHAPNKDYGRLFSRRIVDPLPSDTLNAPAQSAGWLIPKDADESLCSPIFIAHSTFSAIWLLRETLGRHALPGHYWEALLDAAKAVAVIPKKTKSISDIFRATRTPSSSPTVVRASPDDPAIDNTQGIPPSGQPHVHAVPLSLKRRPHAPIFPIKCAKLQDAESGSPNPSVIKIDNNDVRIPNSLLEDELEKDSIHKPEPEHDSEVELRRVSGHEPEPNDCENEPEASKPVTYLTRVSNNNRRAMQRRAKKDEVEAAKRRLEIGLQPPEPKAIANEHAAYKGISKDDETSIAWIIKQRVDANTDFFQASPTPYVTAAAMLKKARSLGNPSSVSYAAQFLQGWREHGTPFLADSKHRRLLQHSQQEIAPRFSQHHNADEAFRFAWRMCNQYARAVAVVNIGDRWALALLGQAYLWKQREIKEIDAAASSNHTRNRYGKGKIRSQAIASLLQSNCPDASRQDAEDFRRRLKRATRWYKIVENLGWGSLLLIPYDIVSNQWLEKVLLIWQLDLFLQLVKRERCDICDASKALDSWLGPEGIEGAPIDGKARLSIEANAPAVAYTVEEIQDSEDDDMEDEVEGVSYSPVSSGGMATPGRLRQMSLLELFHPVRATQDQEPLS